MRSLIQGRGDGIVAFGFEICVSDLRDFVDFAELVPSCSFYGLGCGRGGNTNVPGYFG
jgi:hypothetical protein